MSKCIMVKPKSFFVLEKVVIAGEEKKGCKRENVVVKTKDGQAEDLCKAK